MEWKKAIFTVRFNSLQGYLTENGFVNLERVELIMQAVGVAEDNIFKKRKDDEVRLVVMWRAFIAHDPKWNVQ